MATSQYMSTTNQYIKYWIEAVENSTNVTANTSNVTVKVWIYRTNGYESYGTGTVYVTINGGSYSAGITSSQKITSTAIKIFERTLDVGHSSDGKGTLSTSAYISHNVFSSSSQSWSMGLTTIARASQPTLSASSVNYGSSVTITTNRASTSFTHTVRTNMKDGGNVTIATGVGASWAWTVPMDYMTYIPNGTSCYGTIWVDTYNGSTLIGTKFVTLTLNVPSTVVPTISTLTAAETVTAVSTLAAGYLQGLSKIKFTIGGAAGAYGSTITAHEVTFDGTTYLGVTPTSNLVQGNGSITATAKVTDSRGRTATKTLAVTIVAYSPAKITAFALARCNSDGTLNSMGTYVKVTRAGTWNTLSAKNSVTVKVKSKKRGASTWIEKNSVVAGTSGSYSNSVVLSSYPETESHDFLVEFIDNFNTTISLGVLPTGEVTMSWGPAGIGVGKIWESGALDVGGALIVNGVGVNPNAGQSVPNDNLDTTYKVGRYTFGPTTVGRPPHSYGTVDVMVSTGSDYNTVNNWIWQTAYSTDTPAGVFVRSRINAGAWTAWQEFALLNSSGNLTVSSVYADSWFRSTGETGWYSQTYGGGWYMTDTSWIRAYNGKHVSTTGRIEAQQGYHSLGKRVAWSWNGSISLNNSVTLTHNLGYYPIVVLPGTVGNLQLTYDFPTINSVRVYNFSAGSNAWTGSVHLY